MYLQTAMAQCEGRTKFKQCVFEKVYMWPIAKSAKRQVRSTEFNPIVNTTIRLPLNAVKGQYFTRYVFLGDEQHPSILFCGHFSVNAVVRK